MEDIIIIKIIFFIAFSLYYCQRLSYEQYGSKLVFTFRHAHSEIFWFCFFFFCVKAKSQRFRDIINIRKPWCLKPKPVLFIGFVSQRYFMRFLLRVFRFFFHLLRTHKSQYYHNHWKKPLFLIFHFYYL